jgi:3-oxoacyl-[acyl-carrier-protein] synthase III
MKVVAIEHAVPARTVGNEELIQRILERHAARGDERNGFEPAVRAFFERTGARERRHRAPGERALDFGVAAARQALDAAGWAPSDVDLLIYVGVGRGCIEPATANVFHSVLGLTRATAFDILDACASWLRAIDVARHMLHAGTVRRVMILNCEFNFEEYIRWDLSGPEDLARLGAGFTVGEAATATLLEGRDDDQFHLSFRTQGEFHDLCRIPLPHQRQYLPASESTEEPALAFFAHANRLNTSAIDMLERQYREEPVFAQPPVDVILGHATSVPSRDSVARRLGVNVMRYVDTFERYGNTVSASLPLGLSLATHAGRLERGGHVLMIMASAGITTGLCRFRY